MNNSKQLIIASPSASLYTTKRLLYEGSKLKYSTKHVNPFENSLLLNLKNSEKAKLAPIGSLYFHRTTGIQFDDFDILLSKHYESMNFRVTNPLECLSNFRSKDLQTLFFLNSQLPTIPTFIYRGLLNENIISQLKNFSKSQKYILKMNRGNGGIGVNYIESLKSLLSLLETFHALKDQKLLIQPYINHKIEWRLFMIKSKCVAVIQKSIKEEDFRGNSKKSTARFVKRIPTKLVDMAIKCMEKSKLDYAGIDIMLDEDNNEYTICEINSIPGFEQVENLSSLNIAKELIIHI